MKNFILNTILLTLFFFSVNVFSQQKPQPLPTLVTEVEKLIEEREPGWKIERPYVQTSPPVMHLRKAKDFILIYFWIQPTAKNAAEIFEGNNIAHANMRGKQEKKTIAPNFGDKNYLWTNQNGGDVKFDFRKGNIYISIIAPSTAVAKKFAQYIMEKVKAQTDAAELEELS